MVIQRVTCFRVKNEADLDGLIEQYDVLRDTNQKDGKQYVLEVSAKKTISDSRNQGYNFVAMTKFSSMDDVNYYDEQCPAHKKIKAFNKDKIEVPPLTLLMEV